MGDEWRGETQPLGCCSVAGHRKPLPVLQRHVHAVGLMMAESVFQMIAHAIEGAVAGAMYKAEVAPKIEGPELARTEQTYGTSSTAHHLS